MAERFGSITPRVRGFIEAQHMFFVATAPSGPGGHVNVSPKGYDTFRILGPKKVAYLDLTGSGAESVAHVRENGRIRWQPPGPRDPRETFHPHRAPRAQRLPAARNIPAGSTASPDATGGSRRASPSGPAPPRGDP